MTAQVRESNMIPFLGAFAAFGMVIGTWVVLMFVEGCVLQWDESQMHCGQSVLSYSSVTGGVLVLAGIVAWVAVVIYPANRFSTKVSELPLALFTSFVIGVVSYGLIRWEWYFPNIYGQFSGWLGVGLLVLGMLLIIVNHFSREKKEP